MPTHRSSEIVLEEILKLHGEDLVIQARLWAANRGRPLVAGDQAFRAAVEGLRRSFNPRPAPRASILSRLRVLIWRGI